MKKWNVAKGEMRSWQVWKWNVLWYGAHMFSGIASQWGFCYVRRSTCNIFLGKRTLSIQRQLKFDAGDRIMVDSQGRLVKVGVRREGER